MVLDGLVKRYGALTAVAGLSLRAARGEVTAVLGPNGAGKTTTVEICEGYRDADAGTVRILGHDPRRDAAALTSRVGVMLQEGGVYGSVPALEALRHTAALYADPLPPESLLDRIGLTAKARTPFKRLSGGQQRRLTLALALVGRPELVFLDEPTAGLDPHARLETWEIVRELRLAGVSVILTTHYLEEAEQLADQVVIVDHGAVVAAGSPESLTRQGRSDELRFDAPPGLDLLALGRSLGPDVVVGSPSPGRVVVTGAVTPRLLADVTSWCADRDVMPENLQVARRSLEDVFLDLTRRARRDSQP
ncbi:MAG: ABC transporter ATP-binding protein [Actinomycetes bacterium]